jgi:hypothetical protein
LVVVAVMEVMMMVAAGAPLIEVMFAPVRSAILIGVALVTMFGVMLGLTHFSGSGLVT